MTHLLLAVIVFLVMAIVTAILAAVAQGEFSWWGPRLADLLIGLAAAFEPKRWRATRRAEWSAEVDRLRDQGTPGLLWAVGLLAAGARDRCEATGCALKSKRPFRSHGEPERRDAVVTPLMLKTVTLFNNSQLQLMRLSVSHTAGTNTLTVTGADSEGAVRTETFQVGFREATTWEGSRLAKALWISSHGSPGECTYDTL